MLIDNNRLSHWLAVGILIWLAYLAFLGLPIFHWGLNVSITKVVSFFCAAGLLQLAVTPWMFWARATPSDPNRRFGHRIAAATVWIGSTGILLLCFLQYGKAIDQARLTERSLLSGGTAIAFGILALVVGIRIRPQATSKNPKQIDRLLKFRLDRRPDPETTRGFSFGSYFRIAGDPLAIAKPAIVLHR